MGLPIFQYLLSGSTWTPERRYAGDGDPFDLYINIAGGGFSATAMGTPGVPASDYVTDVLADNESFWNLVFTGAVTMSLIDGKIKISSEDSWSWNFAHASDEAYYQWWGLSSATTVTGTLSGGLYTYTFPYLPPGVWYPNRGADEDTRNRYVYTGGVAKTLSGVRRVTKYVSQPKKERIMTFRFVEAQYALAEYESLAPENNSFEQFWMHVSDGNPFKMADDASNPSWQDYVITDMSDPLKRSSGYKVYWDATLRMAKV